MKRLDYDVEIEQGMQELQALYRKQDRSLARRRLRFLLLLKTGQCTSQTQAGSRIGIGQRAAEKLWSLYRTKGMEGLLQKPHSGQPAKLDERAKAALRKQLDGGRIQTLKEACAFVFSNNGISLSQVAMHYYFKACGIKKKTGRPASVRKDVAGEKRFKKKSFPA